MKYDRLKAVEYARIWWNKRNPKFFNFDEYGGDCTNFISQCLFAGGIEMNYSQNGWFYSSSTYRAPSWSGVEELYTFGSNNVFDKGVKFREISKQEVAIGDIVQLDQMGGRFNHTLLISKIEGERLFVACHSSDAFDKPLANYFYKNIRFLKILN